VASGRMILKMVFREICCEDVGQIHVASPVAGSFGLAMILQV